MPEASTPPTADPRANGVQGALPADTAVPAGLQGPARDMAGWQVQAWCGDTGGVVYDDRTGLTQRIDTPTLHQVLGRRREVRADDRANPACSAGPAAAQMPST